jgi:hypothetical protein
MRGRRTRRRRLLVTVAMLLAGAGVRHLVELHARRLSIAERGPVAALPPPPDPPSAGVSPAVSADSAEPEVSAAIAEGQALETRTDFNGSAVELEPEVPEEPPVSGATSRSAAESSLSRDSDRPTTASDASDRPAQPASAAVDASPTGPPPPAPPRAGNADAQSTRQFPAELQAQAATSAGGWVYEIDPGCDRRGPVSPEHIIGAWRIDDQGAPTGEFVANSLYRPSAPKRRWRRKSHR